MKHSVFHLSGALRQSVSWSLLALILLAGCSRTRYRQSADAESYSIIDQNLAYPTWMSPSTVEIEPDPRSRLYDPTCAESPVLPPPAPQLYGYELPELPLYGPAELEHGTPSELIPFDEVVSLPPVFDDVQAHLAAGPSAGAVLPASHHAVDGQPDQTNSAAGGREQSGTPQVPISASAWQAIDEACLARMFEFATVREEYLLTFGSEPVADARISARRLTLAEIVALTMLNSRAYQTEKENLYRTALNLSLEQFDYDLKFSVGGNRTGADYDHRRAGGVTSDTLLVPSGLQVDKMLATGGTLLGRFANDVLLTFNGPSGFAADVSSELLLDLSQTVFQRDATFERLTQAERNMVYAVRDFIRFRRELFVQIASRYYSLILNYRGIEINAQDYFSFVRQFSQGEAEFRAGLLSRIGVDQFEQRTFSSRSTLISSCNGLESGLDSLKLLIGLPPELPINLDLTELEEITLRDRVAATGELISRARRQLGAERQEQPPDRSVMLNAALVLIDRMLESIEQRGNLDQVEFDLVSLQDLQARLRVDDARLDTRPVRAELARDRTAVPPAPPIRVFQRTLDYAESLLTLAAHQRGYAAGLGVDSSAIANLDRTRDELQTRSEQLGVDLNKMLGASQLDQIPVLVQRAEQLLGETENLIRTADAVTGTDPVQLTAEQELRETLEHVDLLLAKSEQLLQAPGAGLVPVKIEMDDAMLTALVRRFDLMNERGSLADDRRQIKLAADDLKSILNLNATQTVGTRTTSNRPFDFTFDESRTTIGATLDLPLNRKAQRNAFRVSLINYQAGRRSLMQLEDNVKLSIRDDLRGLALQREQYQIAVASAALAYGRVISTQLELQLGIPGVQPRDVIEAQNDYTASLRDVARNHITYITSRFQLFLDMELLEVGDSGFWQPLYDEQYQPSPSYQLMGDALPAYGVLPTGPWYSKEMRCILDVPTGFSLLPAEQDSMELPADVELAPVPEDVQ